MKADLNKEFSNLNLTEVIMVCELQEYIYSLTPSSLSSTVQYISKSLFADSKERISQLVANIFNAIKIRPSSASLYAHFTKQVLTLASPENELDFIRSIISEPFPSISYPSFDRLSFLNECLRYEIITENQMFKSIQINYQKYPHHFLPWKYSFVWFMPLIFKNDQKLYHEMLHELKESVGGIQNTNPIKSEAGSSSPDKNIIQSAEIIRNENDDSVQPNLHSISYETVNKPLDNENQATKQKVENNGPLNFDNNHGNIPVMPNPNSVPHLNSNQHQNASVLNLNASSNKIRKNIKLSKTKFYSILNSTSETYSKGKDDQKIVDIFNNPTRELADFVESIEYLKSDNWDLYNKMVSNTYVPNSLPAILKEDRVQDLIKMIDKYNEKERKKIKKIELENETSDDYVYEYEEEEEEEDDDDNNNKKEKKRILVKLSDGDSYEYESSSSYNESSSASNKNLDTNTDNKNDPESYSIRFQKTSGKFHSLKNSFRDRLDNNNEETNNNENENLTLNELNQNKENESNQEKTTQKEEETKTTENQSTQNEEETKTTENQSTQKEEEIKTTENQSTENNTESNISLNKVKNDTTEMNTTQSINDANKRKKIKRPRRTQEVPEFVGFNLNQRIISTVFEKNNFLRNGPTLVQFAAFYGSVLCVIELIKRGADVLLPDLSNKRTSMFAVAGGNMKIIEILEFQQDDFTSTPQVAAYFIRQEAFNRLMTTNRFKLDHVDDHYSSILHQAAASNNIRVMIYCIENNVDVNIKNIKNMTPLHLAVANGQLDATLLLVAHKKIDVNVQSVDGLTPLIIAVKNGYLQIVKALLLNQNINVNLFDKNHTTALHLAASSNNFEIVQLLVEHKGIDLSIKDSNGRNAAELASLCGFKDCAQFIGEHMKSDCSIA